MLSGKVLRDDAGYGILSQAHLSSSSLDACAEAAHTRPGCAGAQTGVWTHSGSFSYPTVFLFKGGKPTRVLLVPRDFYNSMNFYTAL